MTAVTQEAPARPAARPIDPIPLTRLVRVELRKMFDTRSGFWLMAAIVISALLATAAVIIFASDEDLKYSTFAAAFGIPIGVLLPVIAILSVTSEWSQRSGLATFTLVPHRGRVVLAKGLAAVIVGVVSVLVVLAIGALGTVVGSAIAGVDPVWDSSVADLGYIVLANVLSLLVGFMLGVLIRNSPAAIVAYFVYSFVIPTLSMLLAANASWFEKIQGWVDFNFAQTALYNGDMTGEQWAQLGVSSLIWLVLPLAIGVRFLLRSEIK